jgi:hypothetical protein
LYPFEGSLLRAVFLHLVPSYPKKTTVQANQIVCHYPIVTRQLMSGSAQNHNTGLQNAAVCFPEN